MINFTDDFQKIPERYREASEEVIFPPLQEISPIAPPPSTPPLEEEVDFLGRGQEWWQGEIRKWEQKRDQAAARIQELKQELRHLQFLNIRHVEQIRILEEIRSISEEQQEAERMLHEILPEEARKAGAPPGWFRK